MSDNQLREAYTYMKQGNKKEALRLVQNVLREDRNNINAWWLFSHLLEDEEKIVKSLQKILALSPEHTGARKRLSQMRPEYTNLAPTPAPLFKEKPAKSAQKDNSALAWLLGIVAFFVSAFIGFTVASSLFSGDINLDEIEGPPPEEVAFLQLEAAFSGDYETMRLYTCDSLEDEWVEIIDDVNRQAKQVGMEIDDIHFDFSRIHLEETENTGRRVVYAVSGEVGMAFAGQNISVDILEMSGFEEANMIMTVNDNRWTVCSL